MEELGTELVRQVPALAIFAFVVLRFAAFNRARDQLFFDTLHRRDLEVKDLTNNAMKCICQCSETLGEVHALLCRINGKELVTKAKGK